MYFKDMSHRRYGLSFCLEKVDIRWKTCLLADSEWFDLYGIIW